MKLIKYIKENPVIIVLFVAIIYLLYKDFCKKNKEGFDDLLGTYDKIVKAINNAYKIDIEAIRNLSLVSTKLQKGGLTIPGNLTVQGDFNYLPRGTIVAFNGKSAPKGWALCNGQKVNNYQTPDLRGRFIYGYGKRSGNKIGRTGGSETHQLNSNEMPSHSHSGSIGGAGSHDHKTIQNFNHYGRCFGKGDDAFSGGGRAKLGSGGECFRTSKVGNHSHDLSINNSGGNRSHNNMPPYYVLSYIVKL